MHFEVKSILAICLAAVALIIFLYFMYNLFWFIFIGRLQQQHRSNIFTGVGFLSVLLAIGFWLFVETLGGSAGHQFERLILFVSIGLCTIAIAVAKFGNARITASIISAALVVALNAIGTMFMR